MALNPEELQALYDWGHKTSIHLRVPPVSISSEFVVDFPYVDARQVNEARALLIHQLQLELFVLRFLGQVVGYGGHVVKPRSSVPARRPARPTA